MDKEQQRMSDWLAREVLGLTQGESIYQWNDKDGNRVVDGTPFDPFNNAEQALMVLDKFPHSVLITHTDITSYRFYEMKIDSTQFRSPDRLHTICIAACRATGYQEGE